MTRVESFESVSVMKPRDPSEIEPRPASPATVVGGG
jgi:hypothetical protein